MDLSENSTFDHLVDRDQTAEIIGYVCEIYGTSIVGQNKKYSLYKFVLNNGSNKKLMVCIWDDPLINRHSPNIKINEIMHIDGGQVKSAQMTIAKESQNFVPFDLIIQKTTIVEYLGRYETQKTGENDEKPAQEILFEDVMQADGPIIVKGFIKTKFAPVPSKFGGSTYGCGSITDGNYKITIQVASYTNIDFDKGTPVTVEGELKKNVPCTITCKDSTFIKLDPTIKTPMAVPKLLQGTKTPKRKCAPTLED